jgi:hypothetical protein
LNVSWFWKLFDARRKIAGWRDEYNRQRPHSAPYFTPELSAAMVRAAFLGKWWHHGCRTCLKAALRARRARP